MVVYMDDCICMYIYSKYIVCVFFYVCFMFYVHMCAVCHL